MSYELATAAPTGMKELPPLTPSAGAVAGMPLPSSSIDVAEIMKTSAASMEAVFTRSPKAPVIAVQPCPAIRRPEIISLKVPFGFGSVDLKELARRCWPWVRRQVDRLL